MSAATPGPWMVAKAPSGQMCVVSDDAWICGQLFADNGSRLPREEADANARLIAAAPDLFTELERACSALQRLGFAYQVAEIPELPSIRSALAKARGKP